MSWDNHCKRIPNRAKFEEATFKMQIVFTRCKIIKAHGKILHIKVIKSMATKTSISYHLTLVPTAIIDKIYRE